MISLWRGLERGIWELGLAVALLAVATFAPGRLGPLNRAWAWIGRGLNRVVSPILIIVLFYGVVTPAGLTMRAVGKDPLRLRRDPESRATGSTAARDPRPRTCAGNFENKVIEFVKEMAVFLFRRKKYWLIPIVVMMSIIGFLLVLTQGSALAPFIYALF